MATPHASEEAAFLEEIAANIMPHGLPSDATPFSAVNAAAITTTTLQVIKAGAAGVRMFITSIEVVNHKNTEDQVIMVGDEDDVFIACLVAQDADALTSVPLKRDYYPPLVVAANKDLEGIGLIALKGDCFVSVNGFLGT